MKKLTFLDGAIGSNLMEYSDGEGVYSCNLSCPERVVELHRRYIAAGSEIICSNTFSANDLVIKPDSGYTTADVVSAGVRLALQAVREENSTATVALDIGPLTELLEPYGDLEEEQCEQLYRDIITAGVDAGAQAIFLETFIDLEMLKIAARVAKDIAPKLPLLCSMSFTPVGKTIMGQSVEDMVRELLPFDLTAIGLNCSMEPAQSLPVAKMFRDFTSLPTIFKPNAGKPEFTAQGIVYEAPEIFTDGLAPIAQLDGPLYIGGCCGTTPEHITDIVQRVNM